jgi:hypothetical protein
MRKKSCFAWLLLVVLTFVLMAGGCGGGGGGNKENTPNVPSTPVEPDPTPNPPISGESIVLYGMVFNELDDAPVAGASVSLNGILAVGGTDQSGTTDTFRATSDAQGLFSMEIPVADINAYYISVSAAGFETFATQFTLTQEILDYMSEDSPLGFALSPEEEAPAATWLDGHWKVTSGTYNNLIGKEKLVNLADDVTFTVSSSRTPGYYTISATPGNALLGIASSSMVQMYANEFTGSQFTRDGDDYEATDDVGTVRFSKSGSSGLKIHADFPGWNWGADITLQRK